MYQEIKSGSKHYFKKTYGDIFKCDNCGKVFELPEKVYYCDNIDKLLCEDCIKNDNENV